MSRIVTSLVILLSCAPVAAQIPPPSPAAARRVAITIDDGPVVNEMTDLANFQRVSAGLIGAFQAERVP